MGAFISKQPNGKYCRYSTVVDSVTDYNMTEQEYIDLCVEKAIEKAKRDARFILKNRLYPFDALKGYLNNNSNLLEEQINDLLKEMEV